MPDWTPEREVDAATAQRLIDAQMPHLRGRPLTLLGQGWDNVAYLVGDDHVARFPQRALGAELMVHELRFLPQIHARVPLPVPDLAAGEPSAEYPWPWMTYPLMPGHPAADVGAIPLHPSQAATLGAFLGALHAIAADGARGDTLKRADIDARRTGWRHVPAELAQTGALDAEVADAVTRILETTPADLPQRPHVLLHGDLYSRHVLVDDEHRTITGVIDWGDIHAGDPAQDLAIAFAFDDPGAHEELKAAYGGVDDATWQRARFFSCWHTSLVLRHAVAEDLPDVARSCRRILSAIAAP